MSRIFNIANLLAATALPVLVGACSPTIATRGNLVEDERLAAIKPGATKNDVIAALGSPTTVGTFDDSSWYYMGQRTQKKAFFDPRIMERKVVAVRFDAEDRVQAVEQLREEDGNRIELVERETPTAGKDLTVTEQLLGNMGRFSSKSSANKGPFSTPTGQRGRSRTGF